VFHDVDSFPTWSTIIIHSGAQHTKWTMAWGTRHGATVMIFAYLDYHQINMNFIIHRTMASDKIKPHLGVFLESPESRPTMTSTAAQSRSALKLQRLKGCTLQAGGNGPRSLTVLGQSLQGKRVAEIKPAIPGFRLLEVGS
jgi:hypothetical protein